MNLTPRSLAREAAATGFGSEPLEKVFRLMGLLDALASHPFLKDRIALKGGTALNLFYFDVPRLSVDIDLNYVGAPDRETMLAERPKVELAVQAACSREGLAVRRVPGDHAGGKWRLAFTGTRGNPGTLEVDINFVLRTPLWPCVSRVCHAVGAVRAGAVPVLDLHELAAGKLAAHARWRPGPGRSSRNAASDSPSCFRSTTRRWSSSDASMTRERSTRGS